MIKWSIERYMDLKQKRIDLHKDFNFILIFCFFLKYIGQRMFVYLACNSHLLILYDFIELWNDREIY